VIFSEAMSTGSIKQTRVTQPVLEAFSSHSIILRPA